MDLSTLFQLKTAWSGFQRRHPKFVPFCRAAKTRITEGTVLEITVTPPDGQPLSMNLKVAARDLDALNDCMKREQAFSMTLKGFEQKRARLLAALGLEDVSLRELPSRCPPEHREAARRMSERLINQYRILSSAQEPSRILMESRLRLIEEELQRRGLEEEGPSTASRTGSDTHTDLRV